MNQQKRVRKGKKETKTWVCDGPAISNRTYNPNDERCNWRIVSCKIGYFWKQFNKQNPVLLHRQMPSFQTKKIYIKIKPHSLFQFDTKSTAQNLKHGSSNYSAKNKLYEVPNTLSRTKTN